MNKTSETHCIGISVCVVDIASREVRNAFFTSYQKKIKNKV